MVELKILGPVELRGNEGELQHSFLAGSKRLALLVYLVLNRPRGLHRRDQILPLLWPEKGQKPARNSLSNLLYHIRKALGTDFLITRGTEELGIDRKKISCDALRFEALIEQGNMLEAVQLYRSDLLEGLYVSKTSSQFENWIEKERENFKTGYGEALEKLATDAEQSGNLKEAVKWWKMRAEVSPYDTHIINCLTEVLLVSGNRAEALRRAKDHADCLYTELGINPDETIRELNIYTDTISGRLHELNEKKAHTDNDHTDSSIVILPFYEFGKGDEVSNFASGLHFDLISRLSGVSALTVISRTSVLQYKDTDKPISMIAHELGAGAVLEGTVQVKSGRVRLNIQLIDAKHGCRIWSEIYDRVLSAKHLFDIQSELALKITASLEAKLTPDEKKRVEEWAPTDDLEAHRLYTYGRKQVDKRTADGMKRAVEYFRSAVIQDPDFALAWVGLADTLTLQFDYGYRKAEEVLPKADEAIDRALGLDPGLAEAYASLGLLHSNRHEGSAAIMQLNQAVKLQPSYAEAHNWLSWNYQLLGMPGKALESAEIAVNLNPLSPEAVSNLSLSSLQNGLIEKAISEALRCIEIQPEWSTPAFYQALALYNSGRFSEAKPILNDLIVPWAGNGPLATLALCHIKTRHLDAAEVILERLREKNDHFAVGLINASLGFKDRAFELFHQIEYWDDWDTLSVHHFYKDILEPMKKDPRFKKILHNLNECRGLRTSFESIT
jgi:DNA-binding SARP family transcriptional activator/Flp pilus assembly protein TadD